MVSVVNVTIDLSVTMVIWFPRLVLFLSFAIIVIRVTKQHILEAYFLFLPHGQILTKIFSIHIILQNGTNPRANLYKGINFVQQYLIFVGLQYGTCFVLPFWCLEFSRIF